MVEHFLERLTGVPNQAKKSISGANEIIELESRSILGKVFLEKKKEKNRNECKRLFLASIQLVERIVLIPWKRSPFTHLAVPLTLAIVA